MNSTTLMIGAAVCFILSLVTSGKDSGPLYGASMVLLWVACASL